MILQSDRYSCGAAALVNALQAVGRDLPVAAMMRLAGTTPVYGTRESGVRRALRTLGYGHLNIEIVGSAAQAVATLRGHLVVGRPALLAVDEDEHWVAAIGVVGDRVVLADSAHGELVLSLSPADLGRRWRARNGEHWVYSGIVVVPR